MKQDKFGARTTILLVAFFIMIILLGSFVGRKLVNVVKASINQPEEDLIVSTEEKHVSVQAEVQPSDQQIVEQIYLEPYPLDEGTKATADSEQNPEMAPVGGGYIPTDTPVPQVTNTLPPTATNTQPPTATNTQPPTATNTQTPTATNTQPPTATNTQPPTATNTQPPTATNTQPPTATNTQPPTATNTQPPTATNTQLPTATESHTATPTETATAVFTETPTKTAPPTKLPTVGPGGNPEKVTGVGIIFLLVGSVALCAFFAGLASSKLRP